MQTLQENNFPQYQTTRKRHFHHCPSKVSRRH